MADTAEEIAQLKEQISQLEDKSQWELATPLAEKLAAITFRHYGQVSVETADAVHRWAWLVQNGGDYSKAKRLWLDALAVDEKVFGKGTVQTTRRLHMLGNLYRQSGDYDQADALLRRALALREEHYGRDHPDTAEILRSLGHLWAYTGDYAGAEAHLGRALCVFEKAGYFYPEVASTLSIMGWVASTMGNSQLAEERTLRSVEIVTKFRGPTHDATASSYSDLAMLYFYRREFQTAIPYYQKALSIREKLHGTNHLLVANVLSDLGASHLRNREVDIARPILQRAYELLVKHLGPTNLRVAEVVGRLSELSELEGDLNEAKRLCDEEYDIRHNALGSSHYFTLETLRNRVRLSALLGDSQAALRAAEPIQQAEEHLLQNLLSFTSERQRLICQRDTRFFRSRYGLWADLAAARPLARAIVRTKGLVLDSLLEDRVASESNASEDVRRLSRELNDARHRLTELIPVPRRDAFDWQQNTNQKALSAKIESLEAALARQVTGLGRARRALSIRLEDVQAALPESAVLLEMLRYRHRIGERSGKESYGVLMIARQGEPRWIYLGAADQIERAIRMYQHAVRNPSAEALVGSLAELYRYLWVPLLPHLDNDARRIIISPDGELNFVSFASLLGQGNRFLGEEYEFSYIACSRDLIAKLPESAGRDLVVWANPDFGAPVSLSMASGGAMGSEEVRGWRFRPLPWAETEGQDLFNRSRELGFTNAVLYVGLRASEKELRRLRSPKVLHLATHGFVLPAMNGDTETVASGRDDQGTSSHDPLMRCGLALAGAQRTLKLWAEGKPTDAYNDGIVTALDISVLDLRCTWLVVLAACDTALGEVRAGEGVFGLRRGFVQAGAQNLLMTLWPIDDKHTGHVMSDFYTQLQVGHDAPHALAQVQRKWLKNLRVEKSIAEACRIAGPFIVSFQGSPMD